jgi:hypothetical protein
MLLPERHVASRDSRDVAADSCRAAVAAAEIVSHVKPNYIDSARLESLAHFLVNVSPPAVA